MLYTIVVFLQFKETVSRNVRNCLFYDSNSTEPKIHGWRLVKASTELAGEFLSFCGHINAGLVRED